MEIDPIEIEAFVRALAGTDFEGATTAIRDADRKGEIETLEQAASIAAVFFPPAALIRTGLVLLGLIDDGYATGRIRSAAVEDPIMDRVLGSHAR